MCNNHPEGCLWQGTIGELDQHLDECDYATVECPNDCDEDLLRKDVLYHMAQLCSEREYECPDCHERDAYRVITGPHEDVCEMKMVKCANNECDCVLERGLVQDHVAQDCDYTEVSCKYAQLGCKMRRIRMGMKIHEEDHEGHLSLALKSIIDLNTKVLRLQSEVEGRASAPIRMSDYNYKKKKNIMFESEPFFTNPSGYEIKLLVYANGNGVGSGTHLAVFLRVLEGPFDSQLSWPLRGTFKIQLLNQVEDKYHHTESVLFIDECGRRGSNKCWGKPKFIQQSALRSNTIQYLQDDTLYFRVSFKSSVCRKFWLE